MIFLSELYGRIGQILREKGDMPVVRMQQKGIDNLTTDYNQMLIDYTNTDFSTFIDNVGTNHFVIDIAQR